MAGEDFESWSKTAANNGTADSAIDWHEGQARRSVNNSSRSEMAALAKHRDLLNGSIVTTGVPNAQNFLSGVTYTTMPPKLRAKLKIGPGLTSTTVATLNMDGLGAFEIKSEAGQPLTGGELVENAYVDMLWDGTNWVLIYSQQYLKALIFGGEGIVIGQQVFSTAGTVTYDPTSEDVQCVTVECIGGGGGGGGACLEISPWVFVGGGGGGSGSYSRKLLQIAEAAGQTITVGAGGTGGTGALPGPGDATAGGDSSFGTLCVAHGGLPGDLGRSLYPAGGGAGGAPGIGDIASAGAPGEQGFSSQDATSTWTLPGAGGSSIFGGGGDTPGWPLVPATYPGQPGRAYGSGGAGGRDLKGPTSAAGGNGSAGVVVITEYAGRGVPGVPGPAGAQGPPGPAGAGSGDVLVTGTPTAGQYAKWTDASHIQGVTLSAPQRTVYTSGSGTFTTPAGATWLEVEMIAGAGGGASGGDINIGSNGGNTTFGTLTCNGGQGGQTSGAAAGGTATGGDINISGANGNRNGNSADGVVLGSGGTGGVSPFGGAGRGAYGANGGNASANSGSGGGGGGSSTVTALTGGTGGGAGGYLRTLITAPAASYAYAVGAGGNGGAVAGSAQAGGNGAAGIIIVTSHFGS